MSSVFSNTEMLIFLYYLITLIRLSMLINVCMHAITSMKLLEMVITLYMYMHVQSATVYVQYGKNRQSSNARHGT